jgi:hypothetical protein
MSALEAISPTSAQLLQRPKLINEIIRLDDNPPMTPEVAYRGWLETLLPWELPEYHGLVVKEHRRKQNRRHKKSQTE